MSIKEEQTKKLIGAGYCNDEEQRMLDLVFGGANENKVTIPVYIKCTASKYIGSVTLTDATPEQFLEQAQKLWESQNFNHPSLNVYNDFDFGEWEIDPQTQQDIEFYKK